MEGQTENAAGSSFGPVQRGGVMSSLAQMMFRMFGSFISVTVMVLSPEMSQSEACPKGL